MLDQVNLNQPDIDKGTYKETHDALIERLVTLQQQARLQSVGLVVLFEGWNGAGKGSRISDLMFNLDARDERSRDGRFRRGRGAGVLGRRA